MKILPRKFQKAQTTPSSVPPFYFGPSYKISQRNLKNYIPTFCYSKKRTKPVRFWTQREKRQAEEELLGVCIGQFYKYWVTGPPQTIMLEFHSIHAN